MVYILEQTTGCQEQHICSIHKPLIKSAFPRHFTQTKPKTPLRYSLRQNDHFTPFLPILITLKSSISPSKIHSNPYKLRLQSNSTENNIFNKEITHQKPSTYISSIIQNTSKINTFQLYQTHKQYHSIEVIFFTIKFISNSYQKNNTHIYPNNQTNTKHFLPEIII